MNGFESVTSRRHCGIEGVDKVLWVTEDFGAVGTEGDGPRSDCIYGCKHFMEHVKDFETVVTAGGNCGMYARFYKNYFKNIDKSRIVRYTKIPFNKEVRVSSPAFD